MTPPLKQIEDQARALSPEDRAKLAESLLESLHSPISDVENARAEEIEQRLAALDRGEISTYSAEDVFADAVAHRSRRPEYWHLRVQEPRSTNGVTSHRAA